MIEALEPRRPNRGRPHRARRDPDRRRARPSASAATSTRGPRSSRSTLARRGCATATGCSTSWPGCASRSSPRSTATRFGGGLELAAAADLPHRRGAPARPARDRARHDCRAGRARSAWCAASAPQVRRLSLTGEMLTAEEALAVGLVDEVAPAGKPWRGPSAGRPRSAGRGPVAVSSPSR